MGAQPLAEDDHLGLRVGQDADSKTIRRDEVTELAKKSGGTRELVRDPALDELHRRDRRNIWHDASIGKQALE